jgi:hypothetical protein
VSVEGLRMKARLAREHEHAILAESIVNDLLR